MTHLITITDFRENLFKLAHLVEKGEEIEVEKDGRSLFKVVRVENDAAQRAKKVLKILPKIAGIWKDRPEAEFNEVNEFMRGDKEIDYMRDLGEKVKW